ncbi:ATP-binding protein [Streptomyces griseomycini]|uniref:Anti-sigma regulatory factor (Ser/Thr protein kinase) n=1 Tax=Streptomyces griseomycini TaxID=66895 RepID=A0A7W7LWR6_9ACTN|nr:ATP-binding protein [Streptomyces griseomycini]MBB4897151.1 anti-sigma regulatory factor (Ser/Thr protein kinase) [Streptomyces griseomycini]GGR34325.1 ATP-binding protein [Streptomyces griseomycini]
MNQETQEIAEPGTRPEPSGEVRTFTMLLSSTPRGARLARLLAVDTLRSWGLPEERAGHVVAELAANAATHGRVPGRGFRLTLYVVGSTLRVEVTDTRGDRSPVLREPGAGAESGRGLLLVDALADRWGVGEGRFPRKTVWAEIDLSPPERDSSRSGDLGG